MTAAVNPTSLSRLTHIVAGNGRQVQHHRPSVQHNQMAGRTPTLKHVQLADFIEVEHHFLGGD